jgi:gluconokinase
MVVVLMGVSGSGKTTVGELLAAGLGWAFVEGDDFHPAANVEKMTRGAPLTDDDRRPWLEALQRRIERACRQGEGLVVACSALKDEYRDLLERHDPDCVRFVYLSGSEELIRERLEKRTGHFMPASLLASQFETLEIPEGEIAVDAAPAPEAVAAEIRRQLGV